MHKAAFLDRDGVINRKAPPDEYITRWEDLEILPGVAEAIVQLKRARFQVIVVTNQRAVAKGLMTIAELESIHHKMSECLAHAGATIDAVYYCPHGLQPPCPCRKPEPGMLLQAACDHDLDLAASWMIGDSEKDVVAGKRAGCRTCRLLDDPQSQPAAADLVAASLLAAVPKILAFRAGHPPSEQAKK